MKWAVITFPGTTCDRDTLSALDGLGYHAEPVSHAARDLAGYDVAVLPGGFSYGDEGAPGAMAAQTPVIGAVRRFRGPVLGICNGFQILCEAGLLPGKLLRNPSGNFICRIGAFLWNDESLVLPIAHGYGQYQGDGQVILRSAEDGSTAGVYRGNVIGMMPHPERACDPCVSGSTDGRKIFKRIAAWSKK